MNLRELLNKGFAVLLMRSVGAGLAFLIVLLFARWLGANDFGVFSLTLTIFTILSVAGRWGQDQVLLKRVSANQQTSPDIAKGYYVFSSVLVVSLGLIIAMLVYSLSSWLALGVFHKPEVEILLKMFVWLVVPMSLVFISAESLKALNHPVLASFVQMVIGPSIALLLAYVFWLNSSFSLERAFLFYLIGFFVAVFLAVASVLYYFPNKGVKRIGFVSLAKQGWPMLLATSGALILMWSDIIILGMYVSGDQLGVYAAASRTVMVTTIVLVAMNSLTAPRYAKLYKEGNIDEIARLARMSSMILLLVVSLPTLVLMFAAEWVMSWFGQTFIAGSTVLIILAVGQLVNVASGSVGYLLTMTGKEGLLKNIMLGVALLNIVFSVLFVEQYGITGVAVVTAASVVLWNLLAMLAVRWHLGFWTFSINFSRRNYSNT